MGDTIIKISGEELIRMKGAVMDADRDDAFAMLKILLQRAEAVSSPGMKSHLDK